MSTIRIIFFCHLESNLSVYRVDFDLPLSLDIRAQFEPYLSLSSIHLEKLSDLRGQNNSSSCLNFVDNDMDHILCHRVTINSNIDRPSFKLIFLKYNIISLSNPHTFVYLVKHKLRSDIFKRSYYTGLPC